MDAFELLRRDHDKARLLLDQLRSAAGAEERTRLATQLGDELRVYEAVEAFCFLPLFHRVGEGLDAARAAHEEHLEMRRKAEALEALPAGDAGFAKAVDRLAECVERHARTVQKELFPIARRVLDEHQLAEMTRSMQTQRQTRFARLKGAEAMAAGRDPRDIADARA
jgi:hypothetical protein